ncbi:MAG: iron-sulfur cluster repair protein YtfE [Hydrogenophaga sp.]|nr:iron-sulfur cluster repair protein YtfE [Hydrogenophaga sp.]
MNFSVTEPVLAQRAIGQIAVDLPGATAIFRRLKLDFCCGGQLSLEDACGRKGLETAAVVNELSRLQRADAPKHADPATLIDHILTRYHAVHREQLPELIRMARRVEAVHHDHPQAPHGLAKLLEAMEVELLEHMEKEEQILFPAIEAGQPGLAGPITGMRMEHTGHGEMLEQLTSLTREHTPPPGACNTWQALYAGTADLGRDLVDHIHLENNLLFPVFEV